MNFKSSTNKNPPSIARTLVKSEEARVNKINKTLGTPQETQRFQKGDTVTLNPLYSEHGAEYGRILGKKFVVEESKLADLGDMNPEVLYFVDCKSNPFLAKHFKKA